MMIKWIIRILRILFGCMPIEPDSPTPEPVKLKTVQKCLLWGESDKSNIQDIINKKRCAMKPSDVIATDTKIDLEATKEVQNAGGLVALLVHPWYSPWQNGMDEALELVEKYAKYYDYIALDYEGALANIEFAKKLQQFDKPLIITPMARDDWMAEHYEGLSKIEAIIKEFLPIFPPISKTFSFPFKYLTTIFCSGISSLKLPYFICNLLCILVSFLSMTSVLIVFIVLFIIFMFNSVNSSYSVIHYCLV